MSWKKRKIGLALGGGGVRGLAHIGILNLLEELDLEPFCISGTSMGAIVGSGYALYKDANHVKQSILRIIKECSLEKLEEFSYKTHYFHKEKDLKERFLSFIKEMYIWKQQKEKLSILSSDWLDRSIDKFVDGFKFKDLNLSFSAVAVDLLTGEEVIFNTGNLNIALKASSAIPGIFPPIAYEGRELIDGGIINTVPVEICRKMNPDKIIAVNVERGVKKREIQCGWDVILQSDDIKGAYINKIQLEKADIIINVQLPTVGWSEFTKAADCIKAGYETAKNLRQNIEKLYSRFPF